MAEKSKARGLTIAEATKILDKSYKTIWRWIVAKRLPAQMIGGKWIISEEDLKQAEKSSLDEYGITEREVERCHDYFKAIGGVWEGEINHLTAQLIQNGINPNAYTVLRERGWLTAKWLHDAIWEITLHGE